MARIAFTSTAAEIVGKLAGSVFQYSYGGFQVHSKVSPSNPGTSYQQLRRGDFGFLSSSWRSLTSVQKNSFIIAAGSTPAALRLFIESNINLILINEPQIDTFLPGTVPGAMPITVTQATATNFDLQAQASPTIVPPGEKLLVQSTDTRFVTGIFTNPSMYSPISIFDEGTNMAVITNQIAAWNDRYGLLMAGLRICIKSALINKINGTRGAETINCINSLIPAEWNILDSAGNFLIDADGTFIVQQ